MDIPLKAEKLEEKESHTNKIRIEHVAMIVGTILRRINLIFFNLF
jgi:hypothetical protein